MSVLENGRFLFKSILCINILLFNVLIYELFRKHSNSKMDIACDVFLLRIQIKCLQIEYKQLWTKLTQILSHFV